MRRFSVAATLVVAVFAMSAPVALAQPVTQQDRSEYLKDYHAVRSQQGAEAAGCNLLESQGSCHVKATDEAVQASLEVLQRDLAPPPPPPVSQSVDTGSSASGSTSSDSAAPQSGGGSSGDLADVPGVPSGFADCVARTESTYGQGSSNIYGLMSVPGGDGSIAEQKAAFSQLYQQQGSGPWHPYDGC